MTLRPGARPFATDACVPISRLADCVEETLDDIERSGLVAPIVGHVGDGNFHVSPLIDMENPAEIDAAEGFAARLAHRAIAMGGTCTGEHGVGQKKRAYMEEEHGADRARPHAPRQGVVRSRRTCSIRARCSTPEGIAGHSRRTDLSSRGAERRGDPEPPRGMITDRFGAREDDGDSARSSFRGDE